MTIQPPYLQTLHEKLSVDLDRIVSRFKNPKVTLVVRAPDLSILRRWLLRGVHHRLTHNVGCNQRHNFCRDRLGKSQLGAECRQSGPNYRRPQFT